MTRRSLLRLLPTLLVGALSAFLVAPVQAQVAGTWEISDEGPRGTRTTTVALSQEGDVLTGVMTMARRGPRGGEGSMDVTVEDGSVSGDSFSFVAALQMRGNSIRQIYRGTVDGDVMSGVIEGPRGEQPCTGRRVPS